MSNEQQKIVTECAKVSLVLLSLILVVLGVRAGYLICKNGFEGFGAVPVFSNYVESAPKNIPPPANMSGCQRWRSIPPHSLAFPKSADKFYDWPKWTVAFWVKFRTLKVTSSFALMRKGNISQNGSPSIVFRRNPNGDPCIAFTYKTSHPGTGKYYSKNLTTYCPHDLGLKENEWRHIVWSQDESVMSIYEDGKLVFYNPNTPVELNPGPLRFSDGDQHNAEFANVTVCKGARTDEQVAQLYLSERPGGALADEKKENLQYNSIGQQVQSTMYDLDGKRHDIWRTMPRTRWSVSEGSNVRPKPTVTEDANTGVMVASTVYDDKQIAYLRSMVDVGRNPMSLLQ